MNLTLPDDMPGGDEQERIQRILNEKKRRELEERYDASFSETDASLPPEVEADWLNQLEEYERQFEHARRIPLRQFLGDPVVKPLAEIPLDALEAELDKVVELMVEHGIYLDFLCDVEEAEAYRFISEELLDEEVDDIRIPGMNRHFIYEEFHPNDEYDAKAEAEGFLRALLHRHLDYIDTDLCKDELYDELGQPITPEQMKRRLAAFVARNPTILNIELAPLSCKIEGDYAWVEIATSWETLKDGYTESVNITGRSSFRLKRSPYGGWVIVQARVAGWHDFALGS